MSNIDPIEDDVKDCRLVPVVDFLACENALALLLGEIRAHQRKIDAINNDAAGLARQVTELRREIRARR